MEYKIGPQFTKSIDGRTVIGLFAIHGNRDDGGDRSHPGAFADTAVKGRDRTAFLWQHNSMDPPIAVVNYVRELSRQDLPEKVLGFAPDATGAAEVSRTYLETPRGSEVLAGITAGAINEMSYAYDVLDYKITTDEASGEQTRELLKVKLWDISDVNWGMNPATVASKGLDWKVRPVAEHIDAVKAAYDVLINRLRELEEERRKVGRVLSAATRDRLSPHPEALRAMADDIDALLKETEPKHATDVRRLWLQTQATLARLNGVPL